MPNDRGPDSLPLDSADRLFGLFKTHDGLVNRFESPARFIDGDMHCSTCGGARRMHVIPLFSLAAITAPDHRTHTYTALSELLPCLLLYRCTQCDAMFTVVGYEGPDGPAIAVLPNHRGGLRSPHTPDSVAYYLDQAQRALSVGAYTAGAAMFRGALEQLLFEQGYQTGMLGAKLAALEADKGAGTGPGWLKELDTEFLTMLKDIGNGSIHPNDGDISKQAALDGTLMNDIRGVFVALLFIVYDAPKTKSSLLGSFKKVVSTVRP
jgi:hypothetical protein